MSCRRFSDVSGLVAHVVNRSARKLRLFDSPGDYEAFLAVVETGRVRTGIELFAYCVMPNHFHFLLRTTAERQLAEFMKWFQNTHAKRWHAHRQTQGTGCVYQGRYRAVPIQTDGHFLIAARYVERNALRAGLVRHAQDWPWSSIGQRDKGLRFVDLTDWPVARPSDWSTVVNTDESGAADVRSSVVRGVPFGADEWVTSTFGDGALRTRGRPKSAAREPS
jgi:putative transposase